jgi:hypothetical protein
MSEKIREQCKQLRLTTVGQNIEQVLEQAGTRNWSCAQTIAHLFDIELEQRRQNRIALRFKQSNLLENRPSTSLTSIIMAPARSKKPPS